MRFMPRFALVLAALVLYLLPSRASAQDRFYCERHLIEGRLANECYLTRPTSCTDACTEQPDAFCFNFTTGRGRAQRCGAEVMDCQFFRSAEALAGHERQSECQRTATPRPSPLATPTPQLVFFCPTDVQAQCFHTDAQCRESGQPCSTLVSGWCTDSPTNEPHCYRSRTACLQALPNEWIASRGSFCELRSTFAARESSQSTPVVPEPSRSAITVSTSPQQAPVNSSFRSYGRVQVRGYFRRNGTYVRPHTRRR
jgi:hypothetical protein